MPYRSYEQRVDSYQKAVIPDVVRAKFDARKPSMLAGQQARQREIVDFETKIREVLDDNGIVSNLRVMYLNFGRELFRAKGHQSGTALRKMATSIRSKFVELGLDPTILDQIIYLVIGVPYY